MFRVNTDIIIMKANDLDFVNLESMTGFKTCSLVQKFLTSGESNHTNQCSTRCILRFYNKPPYEQHR